MTVMDAKTCGSPCWLSTIVACSAASNEWVQRHGEPRDPNVDPIERVECIPFAEARNHVQRALENQQISWVRLGHGSPLPSEACDAVPAPMEPKRNRPGTNTDQPTPATCASIARLGCNSVRPADAFWPCDAGRPSACHPSGRQGHRHVGDAVCRPAARHDRAGRGLLRDRQGDLQRLCVPFLRAD